jgi:peroxiredoxin
MKLPLKLVAPGAIAVLALALPSLAALKVDTKAPDFSAQAYLAGKPFTFKLADALKQGPVVVYFFPAAHTPGCNVEAHLFSESIGQFKAQHATVIGVTAGNCGRTRRFLEGERALRRQVPGRSGSGREDRQGIRRHPGPEARMVERTSYVIAPSGTIVHVYSDLKPDMHVKETLDAVTALGKH